MFSGQLTTPDTFSYHTGRQPRFVLSRLAGGEKFGLASSRPRK